MKILRQKFVSLVILVLSVTSVCSGQGIIKQENNRKINLNKESVNKEITINVTKEFNFLRIMVKGKIGKGRVQIELIDPNGEVRKSLTIQADDKVDPALSETMNGYIEGKLEKAFRSPEKGIWLIRLSSNKPEGILKINSLLIYNPRVNMLEMFQIEEDTDELLKI